jgi:hypothetical protein
MWTERLAITLKRVYRNLRTVLKPQTARTMRAAELADRVYVAGVLHAECHRLCQAVVRPLNATSNPCALGANEVALNVAAGQLMSEILHGLVDHSVSLELLIQFDVALG